MRVNRWSVLAVATALAATLVSPAAAGAAPARGSAPAKPVEEHTTEIVYGPFDVPAATAEGPSMLSNAIVRDGGCRALGFCLDMPVAKPARTASSRASFPT